MRAAVIIALRVLSLGIADHSLGSIQS